MKKVLLLIVAVLAMVSCGDQPKTESEPEVAHYVRITLHNNGIADDAIESITISEETEDMVSPALFGFLNTKIDNGTDQYSKGEITGDSLDNIIDICAQIADDVLNSLNGEPKQKEELRAVYNDWRKVYTVTVTMKSGTVENCRVITEEDGETPYCLEKDFYYEFDKLKEKLTNAIPE